MKFLKDGFQMDMSYKDFLQLVEWAINEKILTYSVAYQKVIKIQQNNHQHKFYIDLEAAKLEELRDET